MRNKSDKYKLRDILQNNSLLPPHEWSDEFKTRLADALGIKKTDIRKGLLGRARKEAAESAEKRKRNDLKSLRRKKVMRRRNRRARKKI